MGRGGSPLWAAVLAVALWGTAACSAGGSQLDLPRDSLGRATIVVEQDDDNRPVAVAVGGTVAVQLSSGPPAAFRWQPSGPIDPSVLTMVSSAYRPPLAGGSGLQVLTFQAVGPGSITVPLVYTPTHDPTAVQGEFTLIVSVT